MKQSRYSDSQIISILKQAEAGTPVPDLCREHGMSSASFYKWRSKYGGMDASLMTRMGLVLSIDHSGRLFALHHRLEAVHRRAGRRCDRDADLGVEGIGLR